MTPQSLVEIAVAHGDGIGPEIMKSTLQCLEAVGAPLAIQEIEVGEKVYLQGERAGISQSSWEILKNSKAFLKAPITTPQGGGFRSLNVTIRSVLGLFANIRPCVAYAPFVKTLHPGMDVIIVRENEEDLYTGLEYDLSYDTKIALKIITRPGCERIIRYAFEYARQMGRNKVTCFTKDNILKKTDGLFHLVFDEIKTDYPDIESEHWIVDIGAAKLANTPNQFNVIVLPNLYGDILSDVAAQIAGSVGLAGSANIGRDGAMFEAIHGSAPRRANQNIANPSGLILASVMMLEYLQFFDQASTLHNAWLRTIEDGIHTYDIFQEGISQKQVGTSEFTKAVIERLGTNPQLLPPVTYKLQKPLKTDHPQKITLHTNNTLPLQNQADIHIQVRSVGVHEVIEEIKKCEQIIQKQHLLLKEVFSRGAMIWPKQHFNKPISGNILRLQIESQEKNQTTHSFKKQIGELYTSLLQSDIDVRGILF